MSRSRIIVKDLPEYVVEDRLRELFSQKGEITDVKLIRAKDGKSRRFAFIGFHTDQEAQEAIRYFNRTYIDTYRITCGVAMKHGDANLTRPLGQYSIKNDDNRANKHARAIQHTKKDGNKHAIAKGLGDNSKDIVDVDDPQLQDFLQVHQPRATSKLWANDTSTVSNVGNNKAISNKESNGKSDEVISDMDYFKSRVTKEWSDSESNRRNGAQVFDLEAQEDTFAIVKAQVNTREQRGHPEDEKGVFESCRLFVHNLPYMTTEEELEEHFSQFGCVSQVHLVVDKNTKQPQGRAYILFSVPEFAARAAKELNKSFFQGRLMYVQPAKQRPSNNEENTVSKDQGSKTFKQQRQEKRKAAEASGDTRAWNSLYMRPDTVVENIARKYSVSKSDVLDLEGECLAARIAVGETEVISETKKALKNAGVNVESLEEFANGKVDGLKTSNHVLLVKHLPYGSSKNELAKMFGEFGSLDKIILPPTKTSALVVFLEPAKAKAAFKSLAYRLYKDAPFYLEWAPFNILSQNATSKNNEMNSGIGENDVKRVILEQNDVDIDPGKIEGTVLDSFAHILQPCHVKNNGKGQKTVEKDKCSTKLLVKNVAFEATKKELRLLFSRFGQIKNLRLPIKFGGDHRGFAFVEFATQQEARHALSKLSSSHFYGRHLKIEIAKEDESLDELRSKLSKKRKHLGILDEGKMKFKKIAD